MNDDRKTDDAKGSKVSVMDSMSKEDFKSIKSIAPKTVKGVVVTRGSRTGIAGLQVFLHEDREGSGPRVGADITDKDGRFEIRHSGTVRAIEISTLDSANNVVRKISSRRKDQLSFSLTAEELRRLLPCRNVQIEEREDQWERETKIRREMIHARGVKVIDRLQRRREFGTKIAKQIDLSTVPTKIREDDPTYVEPDATAEEKSDRLLEVAKEGVSQAEPKSRAVKLESKKLETLKDLSAERGKAPLESILDVGVRPNTPPIDDKAKEILNELREQAMNGSEPFEVDSPPDDTDSDSDTEPPDEPGTDTDVEPPDDTETEEGESAEEGEVVSPTQFVHDAIRGLYGNGNGTSMTVGERSDQDMVAAEIGSVNMSGGPADVTSYHEFQNVRIAFDPLWTEYFDREIAKLVEKILGGLEWFQEDLPFGEITALESLEPFLTIAEELGADLDEPVEVIPAPKAVRELCDLKAGEWTALSSGLRADLEALGNQWEEVKASINATSVQSWHKGPSGNYHRKTDEDASHLYVSPDDGTFWHINHAGAVKFGGHSWVRRSKVMQETQFDVIPWTPHKATIYYYHGDPNYKEYIKESSYKSLKIDGHKYVHMDYAEEHVATPHFKREAEKLLETELPIVKEEITGGDSGDGDDKPEDNRAKSNLEALARILSETGDYRFKVFTAGSINFGILLKYQQAWEPQNYQVGDMVSTIPLAPKESRKFNKKMVVKKSRNQKEIESALQTKSDAEENTGRAESEIVRRAQNATNFEATAEGKGGIGVVEFGGSATAKASAQEENSKNKKKMRQAVQKAAHEYKQERRVEITTVDSEELESTESGEISNPNEEITVTYMFYELQKRFLVNERLVDIEPIILVAHDVPLPSEISESWLIRHDWILKRVLLDDSFRPTFKLLEESNKARDVLIGILRDDLRRKVKAFEEIKEQVAANLRVKDTAAAALKKAIDLQIEAFQAQHTTGEEAGDVALTVFTHGLFGSQGLLGMGGTAGEEFEKPEAAEHRQEGAEEMLARASEEARSLRVLLEGAEVALDSAVKKYSDAVRGRFNKELAVLRLRNHIAQNILHYMQAIWEYEPPDQRFFRIYDIRVPEIGGEVEVDVGDNDVTITFSGDGIDMSSLDIKRLSDVADLDKLLGYKGNYMMFPLRHHNYLTAWMVQDYLDGSGHVRDPEADQMPDPGESLASVDTELHTLQAMSANLNHVMAKAQATPEWEEARPAYEAARRSLHNKIQLERAKIADVVVPTDLLFIEALPGKHPLLEDFKLVHRSLDVEKVAAERDAMRLENIRRAARLLSGNYADPEIDKSISVEGAPTAMITEI